MAWVPQVSPEQGWAKLRHDPETGRIVSWHSLPAHSADVAACLGAVLAVPCIRHRLAALAGYDHLPEAWTPRLFAVAFLHDFGKACPDFRAQWTKGQGRRGHACVAYCRLASIFSVMFAVDPTTAWIFRAMSLEAPSAITGL
ncbi:HD domain-containing protein [Roseospira marina]|uniref:HD domain-containing protein n=1 Tax=Roseospira marina TaxID=140057 RepID=UPI0014791F3E